MSKYIVTYGRFGKSSQSFTSRTSALKFISHLMKEKYEEIEIVCDEGDS